jgi:hypothetical protein
LVVGVASRYPQSAHFDYCFHPVHVVKDGRDLLVPCGKCDGCLLHKANEWSMRVGCEVEATPFSIFFTLTYNNKYVPTLKRTQISKNRFLYTSSHDRNIRFNGVTDVPRKDDIAFTDFEFIVPITNYYSFDYLTYSSKLDFQLYLKLLRKDLQQHGFERYLPESKTGFFRYFAISEYGETLYRSHIHGIIFPSSEEIGKYLLEYSLFQNWQMCDKDRFYRYAHFCDSGVRGYVTQYLTMYSRLPEIYHRHKELKPFRLSSKAPAVGYISEDKAKIFEDLSIGVIDYSKDIKRLGDKVVLQYPADYLRSVFPKCYQYATFSFSRLLTIYGLLFRASVQFGRDPFDITGRFHSLGKNLEINPMDYRAAVVCCNTCISYGCTPFHYLYLLDMYYYKTAMRSLWYWYKFQEDCEDPFVCLSSYIGIVRLRMVDELAFCNLIASFGLDVDYYFNMPIRVFIDSLNNARKNYHMVYFKEVSDISNDMVKMPKVRELDGSSPVFV